MKKFLVNYTIVNYGKMEVYAKSVDNIKDVMKDMDVERLAKNIKESRCIVADAQEITSYEN